MKFYSGIREITWIRNHLMMNINCKYFITICLAIIFNSAIQAQNPEGLWKNIDDDGNAKSVIRITVDEGVLSARVVKFLPSASIKSCEKCQGDEKGMSLLDIDLLEGLRQHDGTWKGGQILNPKTGKRYKALVSFEDEHTLNVRGYIGKPIFGKSYHWKRVVETPDNAQ
ncbi:MAG: DUF2147 domain-containing protein [Saprospiraceae bacterium]|nr:DUF2147 domain-containing protein [Bacteroidia bacterium]NNF21275.1 DUF2147 domain-containing protein [Saprospiraceae bacterium]